MSAEKKIIVGKIDTAKVIKESSILSVIKDLKRNSVPAIVKSRIETNIPPTHSKMACTKGTFNTPIAKSSWANKPKPTVLQLIAFLLLLNLRLSALSSILL